MKDQKMKTKVEYSIRCTRWISLALILALLTAGANSTFAQMGTQVRITPDAATIAVGQTVEMIVQIEDVANLYGVEMLITFDHALLEVLDADPNRPGVQITAGEFLSGGMNDTNIVTEGSIEYIMQQAAPANPSNGAGALARITFRGIGSGVAAINVADLTLYNQAGQGLGAGIRGAQITVQAGSVNDPTATPFAPTPVSPTPVPPTPVPPTPVSPTPIPPTPLPQTVVVAPIVPVTGLTVNCITVQGYHIVQRGETLYAIARAYATDPYAIGACNPTVNPRRIHASNHLAIPYAPWTVPPGPTAVRQFGPSLVPAPAPTPAPGCRARHVVQPHETLTAIGLRYGVNIWDIARVNRIYNLHLINTGQGLCIP
jgi:LysM repeat protein